MSGRRFNAPSTRCVPYANPPRFTPEELRDIERIEALRQELEHLDTQEMGDVPIEDADTPMQPCLCLSCHRMPTPKEQKCCHSEPNWQDWTKTSSASSSAESVTTPLCITETPHLVQCLSLVAVEIRWLDDRRLHGHANIDFSLMDNASRRHFAYRNYIDWMHGRLGRGNRRVIPACVVWFVRRAWPSPDGRYVGYRDPDDQIDELTGLYNMYT